MQEISTPRGGGGGEDEVDMSDITLRGKVRALTEKIVRLRAMNEQHETLMKEGRLIEGDYEL